MVAARRRIWPVVRKVWITLGLTSTAVFVVWSLIAVRPSGVALQALQSDSRALVAVTEFGWSFTPTRIETDAGLLFFAGALVDPRAYAFLLRQVAEEGYPVLLVRLPRRGAFGGADGAEVLNRGVSAMTTAPVVRRWVLAGHSRGGEVASRLARLEAPSFAALVLIGTSHPRDFSLAQTRLAVTRIFGTRDTVADVEKLERNRVNLPASIRDVRIDGGNHSQFGDYGFQPGDWPATITRDTQRRITLDAVLDALRGAASR